MSPLIFAFSSSAAAVSRWPWNPQYHRASPTTTDNGSLIGTWCLASHFNIAERLSAAFNEAPTLGNGDDPVNPMSLPYTTTAPSSNASC